MRLEPIAYGFSFPTSLAFDDEGAAYVAEAGLPFGGAPPGGRVWRLGADGDHELLVDGLRPPVNGLTSHDGSLYVSEGGHPARIARLDPGTGQLDTLLDGLPGPGNYHTNMTVVGPDGKLYFSQGAMTNSGIVGLDAYELGWLRRLPHAHDVPGLPVTLAGVNVETPNPLEGEGARATTGAFAPFGTATEPGQHVAAGLPCTAAVMRCDLDGTGLELVAWGLRNAFGLVFLPDGRLLATDQGADDRGSRPIGEAPDLLFAVARGCWYGWPDFVGGVPVTDARFAPERGEQPRFVLASHDELPPPEEPLLAFPPHACAVKLAVLPETHEAWPGQLLVALFGDERPMTAPAGARAGRSLALVDPGSWTFQELDVGPLNRPIDVAVSPRDGGIYVLDFGRFEIGGPHVEAEAGSGTLLRLELA